MEIFFLFAFGLIIGSFLNVVIFRYDPQGSIFNFQLLRGRSRCPLCKTQLRWYELIPLLSFLIQKGKCNYCSAKISWQYPLIELASGFIFLLPLYFFSYNLYPLHYNLIASLIWILVFLIFLIIWVIDYRFYLIPDGLNIALVLLGFFNILLVSYYNLFNFFQGSFVGSFAALFGLRQNIWLNHFFGALIGVLVIGLVVILTRGRGMGIGDLKLLAAMGFLYGWPDVVFIFVVGTIIGSLVSLFLMLLGKKDMKSVIPFGPFLVLAGVIIFFFGEGILKTYFNFFGL